MLNILCISSIHVQYNTVMFSWDINFDLFCSFPSKIVSNIVAIVIYPDALFD